MFLSLKPFRNRIVVILQAKYMFKYLPIYLIDLKLTTLFKFRVLTAYAARLVIYTTFRVWKYITHQYLEKSIYDFQIFWTSETCCPHSHCTFIVNKNFKEIYKSDFHFRMIISIETLESVFSEKNEIPCLRFCGYYSLFQC